MSDDLHLASGENLGIFLIAYLAERIPQSSRLVYFLAEEAQGTIVGEVGIVELG